VGQILQVLRQTNAAMAGLFSWTTLAATFRIQDREGVSHPEMVCITIMLGAVSLLVNYFVTGRVDWDDIALEAAVIFNGARDRGTDRQDDHWCAAWLSDLGRRQRPLVEHEDVLLAQPDDEGRGLDGHQLQRAG
jgi:hypothetical protein